MKGNKEVITLGTVYCKCDVCGKSLPTGPDSDYVRIDIYDNKNSRHTGEPFAPGKYAICYGCFLTAMFHPQLVPPVEQHPQKTP